MPSTATITAFYNFTANTKARASQVNTNFDTFRGHILPVSPTTATAINNTYDLGSSEYRWRNLYLAPLFATATVDVGGFAYGAKISAASFYTTTSTHIAGSTVTISTIGRPIEYSFAPFAADGVSSYIGANGLTASAGIILNFEIMRNGATAAVMDFAGAGPSGSNFHVSPSAIKFIDFQAAGTYSYSVKAYIQGSVSSASFVRVAPYAKEF